VYHVRGVATRGGAMAVRILLVLAVYAIFYGCGESSSAQSRTRRRGVEPKSTTPVGPGQQLAFGIHRAGYDLYVMDAAGSSSTRLTDGAIPAWSPGGKQIAYTRCLKEPDPYASSAPASVDAKPVREVPSISS
jgi:spore germination protein YaaH